MTNLTEQWKKGELIEGKKYYCVSKIRAYMLEAECHNKGQDNEWWTLENEKYRFNNVFMINDIKVLAEVPSYEEWQAKLEENTKLKELLKECREHFITYKRDDLDRGYVIYDGSYLIDKINQVLGEE